MAEINRRDFVRTSLAGGLAVGVAAEPIFGQAPAISRYRPAGRHLVEQRQPLQERRRRDLRPARVSPDDQWDRRARRPHCRRQHRGTRSRGHERRFRGPSERRRRGPARFMLHARPQEARGRCRVARRRPHTIARGQSGHGAHRPSSARRPRRTGVRAEHGLHHRGGPQYPALPRAVARVEAPHRSRSLPRPAKACRRRLRRRSADGRGGADRPGPFLRHDQLQRRHPQGRNCRRHDNERPGLEDPRPRGRLAAAWRRAVRGRRGRCRRIRPAAAKPTSTASAPS